MTQSAIETEVERLSMRYAGPALEANSMDVRQLAPSLLALADLVAIAHSQINPTLNAPPTLEVAGQRGGSFIVDLWLAVQENVPDLFTSSQASAAANGVGIGAPIVGAVSWLVSRRRRGQESSVTEAGAGIVRVDWPDGTTIEAPLAAQSLIERMDFNRTASQVFEPLRADGVDAVELHVVSVRGRETDLRATVAREDLPGFNPLLHDEGELPNGTRIVTVRIESIAFKVGNKWRVHDGQRSMWASLDDPSYVQQMVNGEVRFGDGDRLLVHMHDKQVRSTDGEGSSWEHSITKVIEHRHSPPPDQFAFDSE